MKKSRFPGYLHHSQFEIENGIAITTCKLFSDCTKGTKLRSTVTKLLGKYVIAELLF